MAVVSSGSSAGGAAQRDPLTYLAATSARPSEDPLIADADGNFLAVEVFQ
jgi:hypothetical protein